MQLMCKFEANRCSFRVAENRPSWKLCHLDSSVIAFVLQTQLNTDFFQRILYLNSVKDNIMQLMRKFEANRYRILWKKSVLS